MEIVKCWAIDRGDSGNKWLTFFETKEEAFDYIRGLARPDKQSVHAVFETFAGVHEQFGYVELWSEDFPNFNSGCGLQNGEYIMYTFPEFQEIINK